jgi:hypothetical protein
LKNILKLPLGVLKKAYSVTDPDASNFGRNWKMFPNKEYASELIYEKLIADEPFMIARIGSTEALCLTNYLAVKYPNKFKNVKTYIKGQTPPWWWEKATIDQMQRWSGFFPGNIEKIEQFCELMLSDLLNVDLLGSWLKEEKFFSEHLINAKRVMLEDLEPFFVNKPWTAALANKKVLVVHPFEETIQQQFLIKDKLFDNKLLPDFELITIKAVQTIAGEISNFNDWFEALDSMKEKIAAINFDICILGCGAYGLPLASYVKGLGKKAIHLGGVTQLLFGIKGKRWENFIVYPYENLYNDFWVRPGEKERPRNAQIVEGACYW